MFLGSLRWRIAQVAPGKYRFTNDLSGKALDIVGGHTADGTALNQFPYKVCSNQMWSFTPTGDGYYKFSPASNPASSIDVAGWSTEESLPIEEWAYHAQTNQQWSVTPAN